MTPPVDEHAALLSAFVASNVRKTPRKSALPGLHHHGQAHAITREHVTPSATACSCTCIWHNTLLLGPGYAWATSFDLCAFANSLASAVVAILPFLSNACFACSGNINSLVVEFCVDVGSVETLGSRFRQTAFCSAGAALLPHCT